VIWLTWRQHRRQALFVLGGLALLAAALVLTGRPMHRVYTDTGLASCLRTMRSTVDYRATDPASGLTDCYDQSQEFQARYGNSLTPAVLLLFVPLLVGLFLGAPLVARELQHGTHRLAWTQGMTRRRWALAKFGLIVGAILVLAVTYALLVNWWITPLALASAGRFEYGAFDLEGIVPVAYTLFAVALGIFAGTVTRKVLPAMAVTLIAFIGVRLAVLMARPHFLTPVERRFPVVANTFPNPMLSDWILRRDAYDSAGRSIAPDGDIFCDLPCPEYDPGAYNLHVYQPAGRFWLFQSIEAGVFVALAALLLLLALRQVRRTS
jgi:ABC-type transport system involved in multi-copper enzyme maturation permease subunit